MMMASCSVPTYEAKDESTMVPNWLELPSDITVNIFQRLDTIDIVKSVCLVCSLWWNIFKQPLMWRTIRMVDHGYQRWDYHHLVEICCHAIRRSCGHLENIYINSFGFDDLLRCLAWNSSNLRCMKLGDSSRISNQGFSDAVSKLTKLEEIEIFNLSSYSLEVLGRSCPHLKSLKFVNTNVQECMVMYGDAEAIAIGKTMPALRHLFIKENCLTQVGLIAILDGCPLLETLDLEECYELDLTESLLKRCHTQIKDFQLSNMYNHGDCCSHCHYVGPGDVDYIDVFGDEDYIDLFGDEDDTDVFGHEDYIDLFG